MNAYTAPLINFDTTSDIIEIVCLDFNCSIENLRGRSRQNRLPLARQIACVLLSLYTRLLDTQIADALGYNGIQKRHSVGHAKKHLEDLMTYDKELRNRFDMLRQRCKFAIINKKQNSNG